MTTEGTADQPSDDAAEITRRKQDERIEEASRESFPASDPPSFTPLVASRPAAVQYVSADAPLRGTSSSDNRLWALHAYELLDQQAVDAYTALLAEDVSFIFGRSLPLSGRDAVHSWISNLLRNAGPTDHRITSVTSSPDGNSTIVEADVRYTLADGTTITVPEATSFKFRGDHASRVQVYSEILSLLAR